MQKKLIALAVAGLVSGAAFAQVAPNNIVLGGIIDVGVQSLSGSTNGSPSQFAVRDGAVDGSRFTINGTEDLGNGLSVAFSTEFDFSTDISGGGSNASNGFSVAKSNLSLNGGFGSVKVGAFGSVQDDLSGFWGAGGRHFGDSGVGMDRRSSVFNGVEYISPVIGGGFQGKLGFSTNDITAVTTAAVPQLIVAPYTSAVPAVSTSIQDNNNFNVRAYFGLAQYTAGGLRVGATYEKLDQQNTNADGYEWTVAGGYDFGVVKFGLGYDRSRDLALSNVGTVNKAWRLSVGAPIGAADSVAATYSRVRADSEVSGAQDNTAHQWGVSYSHDLSKRTFVYASYGHISADNNFLDIGNGGVAYRTGVDVGIHHSF